MSSEEREPSGLSCPPMEAPTDFVATNEIAGPD